MARHRAELRYDGYDGWVQCNAGIKNSILKPKHKAQIATGVIFQPGGQSHADEFSYIETVYLNVGDAERAI